MPENPLPSITPACGIVRNELKAPEAIFVAVLLLVIKPSDIIPFNSAVHSELDGTLKPLGQGLLAPPSGAVLLQGCTFQTPPVLSFQSDCDVQGCELIE